MLLPHYKEEVRATPTVAAAVVVVVGGRRRIA